MVSIHTVEFCIFFNSQKNSLKKEIDIVWGLIFPIGNYDKLRNFILQKLSLKTLSNNWKVSENLSPNFMSFHHRNSQISLGMDDQCLVILSSWWSNDRNPEFLDEELNNLFVYGQNSKHNKFHEIGTKLTGDDYDVGLSY